MVSKTAKAVKTNGIVIILLLVVNLIIQSSGADNLVCVYRKVSSAMVSITAPMDRMKDCVTRPVLLVG